MTKSRLFASINGWHNRLMSGPVDDPGSSTARGLDVIEVREGRSAQIGDLGIVRVLPTKRRRTIGPWCFVDLMQNDDLERPPPLEIGPHPHIGLATVTWLFAGTALHTDSLGTEQLIRPGQLNLMTSGHGIAHAEEGVETEESWNSTGTIGVQMWLAQTETTRGGLSAFQHLSEVPRLSLGGSEARVLIGSLEGTSSPARTDHPTIGLDVDLDGQVTLPTDSTFEHGVVPIDRPLAVDEVVVEPGSLAIVPPGRSELRLETRSGVGRLMLLGGAPLGEEVKMWWNFVARSNDEITDAWRAWEEGDEDRFGRVPSMLPRIEAPRPPWLPSTDT